MILLSIYHIVYIICGISTVLGIVGKLVYSKLKLAWTTDLAKLEKDIDKKINEECGPTVIRNIVKEELNNEMRLVNQSLSNLAETLRRLEEKIDRQEETIIAMQNSLCGLVPKIENLEKETTRLEAKKQDKV